MAQLIDIQKVTIDPANLVARISVSDDGPLLTSEDPEGTARVLELAPGLASHLCLGDDAPKFGDVVKDTEVAHLLEHLAVELLARTDLAGDVSAGRTEAAEGEPRAFDVTLACPDDVLTAGALSSAAWVLEWAYNGGGDPVPDLDAIVKGLVDLVHSLDGEDETDGEADEDSANEDEAPAGDAADAEDQDEEADATVLFDADQVAEAAEAYAQEPEAGAYEEYLPEDEAVEAAGEGADVAAEEAEEPGYDAEDDVVDANEEDSSTDPDDGWNMENIPAPRPVR